VTSPGAGFLRLLRTLLEFLPGYVSVPRQLSLLLLQLFLTLESVDQSISLLVVPPTHFCI
jgi:hypothetical protein